MGDYSDQMALERWSESQEGQLWISQRRTSLIGKRICKVELTVEDKCISLRVLLEDGSCITFADTTLTATVLDQVGD